jgi:hypothetical protein
VSRSCSPRDGAHGPRIGDARGARPSSTAQRPSAPRLRLVPVGRRDHIDPPCEQALARLSLAIATEEPGPGVGLRRQGGLTHVGHLVDCTRIRGSDTGLCSCSQVTSSSRTKQRRSNKAGASTALTRMRMRTKPPTASVTCSTLTRWSHRGVRESTRSSSSRMCWGVTLQSRSNSTEPSSSEFRLVQFWYGFEVKYVDGRIMRRSSQMCTTT